MIVGNFLGMELQVIFGGNLKIKVIILVIIMVNLEGKIGRGQVLVWFKSFCFFMVGVVMVKG